MPSTLITAGDVTTSLVYTGGNDNTLTLQTGPSGAKVNAAVIASDGTPTFLKVPAVAALQSMVRLNTTNGYGTTNTVIGRFLNVVTNQGADITYADSATLGATFTINTNGVYAIMLVDSLAAAGDFGLSLNSNQLSTAILGITNATRIASTSCAATFEELISTTLFLSAGDIVRIHGNGAARQNASYALFTITRVS